MGKYDTGLRNACFKLYVIWSRKYIWGKLMTKTFLLLSDERPINPKKCKDAFAKAGVSAEFEHAVNGMDEWLDDVRSWKERGLKFDVACCDLEARYGNYGITQLERFLDAVVENIGEEMLPKKIFFYSGLSGLGPVKTKYGTSSVLCVTEVMALEGEQGIYSERFSASGEMLNYLNEHWCTNFITSRL